MKDSPILFSAPMVRAILEGRKTQTRRMVKPQPPMGCGYIINGGQDAALCYDESTSPRGGQCRWVPPTAKSVDHLLPCPYGQPGNRLWVRETWGVNPAYDYLKPSLMTQPCGPVNYRATDIDAGLPDIAQSIGVKKWRPSIFMLRWMSRITLAIVAVRVGRLQEISEADAIAEGIHRFLVRDCEYFHWSLTAPHEQHFTTPVMAYRDLWEVINGTGSWAANPFVWVVEFKRIEQTN